MKIDYNTLLGLIPRESDREKLSQLSGQLYEGQLAARTAEPAERSAIDSQQANLLDQLTKTIQWHFRAMRRPMPTSEEISEMVNEHFQKEGASPSDS